MVIINVTRNTVLANNCRSARTFFTRFLGLQFKKELPEGHGLLITPCNSIHMFLMRFAIDAVFIDADGTIIYIREGIKPWRVSKIVGNAKSVLELPAGTVKSTGTATGDILEFNH
ncbi:MAG TPA: DUF192 domain-containing protein [Clostridia bacterium]|nr:DUF192 domain-containing protein [Clostridia bacterium]